MTERWGLVREEDGRTIVEMLEVADGFLSRLKGLQFRVSLPRGAGLLLVPCPSVHTFFVRFPIDLVLLDRRGEVIGVRSKVRPWRLVWPVRRTYATLEMPAGTAAVAVGDVLRLTPSDRPARASLAFLLPASARPTPAAQV